MDSWAASGATPLKFSATVSPRLARWTSMVPEPAMVDMNGSTTALAKAVGTAASTALPPPARMAAPTSAPRGCSATTMPRWASGVCLVTTRRERIMRPSGSAGRHVLRDVDEALAGEEHVPAMWIHPHLGGVALDGGPVAAGDLFHLGLVGAHGHRRAEQDQHLLLVHAHRDLAQEAERRDVQRAGPVGMRAQVGADLVLHVHVPLPLLLERRLPSALRYHPLIQHLLPGGPRRTPLLHRLPRHHPTPRHQKRSQAQGDGPGHHRGPNSESLGFQLHAASHDARQHSRDGLEPAQPHVPHWGGSGGAWLPPISIKPWLPPSLIK